jgi:hypothetical protein
MSSYAGSTAVSADPTDPTLQLAPADDNSFDFGAIKKSFEDCVANNQSYADQCRINYDTRFALWPNQSADGRKHSRDHGKTEPTPWEGSSDLQVFLTDEAINSKVALLCMAFRKASISAVPIEGNDLKRAKTVSNFMRWLIQTQIPEIDRETELLSNYIQEKGLAVTGQFWETVKEKTLVTISTEQLQSQYPDTDWQELLFVESMEDTVYAMFEAAFGCSERKSKKMLKELRETGKTTVPTTGKERSRPVIRAFNLDQDVFVTDYTTDLEKASGIFRLEYFTPEQLRALVHTADWNADWVEDAIEKCRGQAIAMAEDNTTMPISRSFTYISQQRYTDRVGVVYAYQRLSDEEGIPGIYCTIFNPLLGPADGGKGHKGFAKTGLLGYAHGEMPFVLHRREYLSRRLHDSRGIPEPGKPYQDQIKVHRDSLIDAASMSILPPFMHPIGRPPTKWGPGARIGERRPGEYRFGERPQYDPSTEKSQQLLMDSFNRYNGFVSAETDPTFSSLKNQFEVDKYLTCWSKAFRQVWKLYQQYGSEEIYFRVVGLRQAEPAKFTKGDPSEEFDFVLTFSVDSMDLEKTFQKMEQIAKIVATADKDGAVNYSEWLQVMIEAVDPNIAERIIDPANVGRARVVSEMQDTLAKVFAGQDQDINLGTPPELGLQIIQGYVQGDPVVQRRMQDPEDPFASRIEKLAKQLNFQSVQQTNAKIGKYGA